MAAAQDPVHHVQVRGRVGHYRDVPPGLLVGGQRPQGARVHGRVGDQQVIAGAQAVQPEGFGQRVAHQPPVAGAGQRPRDQEAAPQRLGGDPDRAAGRAAGHVGGVPVERVQIDDGQRRIEVRRGPVIPGAQVIGSRGAWPGPAGAVLID
jgi:hypothetical protein